MDSSSNHITTSTVDCALLMRTPMFQGIDDDTLKIIAHQFKVQSLLHQEVLFYINTPGDRFYVVADGTLEVVRQDELNQEEVIVNEVHKGAAVGELAILHHTNRTATVRAKGPAQVYFLEAAQFSALMHQHPSLAVAVARYLGHRLNQVQNYLYARSKSVAFGIAISPRLDTYFLHALTQAFHAQLSKRSLQTSVVFMVVNQPQIHLQQSACCQILHYQYTAHDGQLIERLNQILDEGKHVIVISAGAMLNQLTTRLDGVLIDEEDTSCLAENTHLKRTLIYATHGRPSSQRIIHHKNNTLEHSIKRITRMILKNTVGIALGGGAALGIAHIGVLKALEELDIDIDYVAGTSMGSIVGALYAANGVRASMQLIQSMSRMRDWLKLIDYSVLTSGMIHAEKIKRFLKHQLSVPYFEDLAIPLAMVGFDVNRGEEMIIAQGSLVEGIRASIAIPGIFSPHIYHAPDNSKDKRLLVDGGVINNVPVDVVRNMGADRVIGVHVMVRHQQEQPYYQTQLSQMLIEKSVQHVPFLARFDILVRSHYMMMVSSGERQVFNADFPIIPHTGDFGFMEFWKGEALIEKGYEAIMAQKDQLKALSNNAVSY